MFKPWPGPAAEMCRGFLLYKIWRILSGIFLEDFSRHFSHQKRETNLVRKSAKKIRQPKNKNREKNSSAKIGSPLTPLFLRGGFLFWGFLPIFCLKERTKQKTGVTKTGVS